MNDVPTAVFDLFVDEELKDTVETDSRGSACRILGDRNPDTTGVAFQGRAQVKVREHQHEPSAGNTSICVFCQAHIGTCRVPACIDSRGIICSCGRGGMDSPTKEP